MLVVEYGWIVVQIIKILFYLIYIVRLNSNVKHNNRVKGIVKYDFQCFLPIHTHTDQIYYYLSERGCYGGSNNRVGRRGGSN